MKEGDLVDTDPDEFQPSASVSSRQDPTMTMEEGLRKGLQEWQRTSNFDRMVFYETSQK
ncbi:Hypothetical predicted protein [Marmota monax]|uniref:Nuclear Testis protein N-terminal domain-containing protein n=1 Tax=Marmota monax TaxID=9995 RepID=A0A5E4CDD2_MARMO|nr:Hypothetical predicted protein [Marmota monax]